jgi:hypothetical protein
VTAATPTPAIAQWMGGRPFRIRFMAGQGVYNSTAVLGA